MGSWGWLEGKGAKTRPPAKFVSWLRENYPWIRLNYVPAGCTPKAQPMDAGIIAKIKGVLRKYYGKWAVNLTVEQLNTGKDPSEIRVPSDVPTCKKNLFIWLSRSVTELNSLERSTMTHCWDSTDLSQAWNSDMQDEALSKYTEIFPNLVGAQVVGRAAATVPDPANEDSDASWAGLPFIHRRWRGGRMGGMVQLGWGCGLSD